MGAVVLLPEGFDEHPDAHYPVLYYQGHFAATFSASFRTEPPPPAADGAAAAARGGEDYAYKFYQDWTSGPPAAHADRLSRRTPTRTTTIPTP